MSDEPLFQNSDVQEAAYAGDGGDNDQSGGDGNAVGPGVVIPAAGLAGMGGGGMGGGGTAGTGGGGGAVGPALAGAALAGGLDDDDDRDNARHGSADGANDAAGQTPSG